ncbi:hypothetical protein MMC13_006151 [Lambiella insularis]|nr:hypothetical protein [Lambiella insularis]
MAPIPSLSAALSTLHMPRALSPFAAHDSTLSQPHWAKSSTSHPLARSLPSVFRRQSILPLPATYSGLTAGPDPGTIVGITLGSVAGFLLILWLLYSCFNMGTGGMGNAAIVAEEVVSRRSVSPRPRRARPPPRTRSVSRSEMSEVRSPPRREQRRETVIIEETRRPVEREDDIVEVIEEHSPPPRRVRSQRVSGYRTVDPDAYGGGERPLRKVRH